jgi:hypothetical protein
MKTFIDESGRTAMTDLRDCVELGFLRRAPSYNAIFDYMNRPEMAPLLTTLIEESASPLAEIDRERAQGCEEYGREETIALDATGMGSKFYKRWFVDRVEKEARRDYVKLHVAIGVRSKIITTALVTPGSLHESNTLPDLITRTSARFTMSEVLADKGYIGLDNLKAIEALGAKAYIPFRETDTARAGEPGAEIWQRLWHLYMFHRPQFLARYHKRSNVEAVFSGIKRRFGPALHSRNDDAKINEALTKVLCWNLTRLVLVMSQIGLDPTFWCGPVQSVTAEFDDEEEEVLAS